ncbi:MULTISPECIES: class II glutamine amidotransferase [unclassified Mycolicibacterium]|uniref:class II glutamine amidotransferase n=1 Tax=unclassified Mycolicibacterium TaxID=2636767 RepID=UPI0012DF9A1F|nr:MULTISPECIES: class II glutamine amidotransferase [unclassified Mycolicibacterium]MUL85171.1 class II glutamine amidotransferase [Mycolicibacterium sp. CBMA 329]MUL91138.1 class II glutamine amidotransferase [Mycolicibacterium sp. CBMA 331]MUL98193.1 class II glutamine amidotransferase [Mycolicibacterium sp. CBMA 334]MUM26076.1 class II glutamine amidotransferase [Mycolicibacterium sp. CBMA 295]MUM40897.1 class II glutamine amidotransferase [Mycolicibacterium sp. CBMA 247]
MCRLFGLHAGRRLVAATFWLLDAPDNLAEQSRRNPDGTGLGVFGAGGVAELYKEPVAAWQDSEFATEAHDVTATTFIAHVRYASTGALDLVNTHPFLQDGRIFAHNGVVDGLDALDDRIRELGVADLVGGQTDSERVFALITAAVRAHDGDVGAGVVDAIGWLADNVPIYAVNLLLSTATDMWALRYPDTHELYVLDRRRPDEMRLRLRSRRIRAESEHLSTQPSVVFASEPMDGEDWQLIAPGELVHVDADLGIDRRLAFPDPPRHLLRPEDLSAEAAASQHA